MTWLINDNNKTKRTTTKKIQKYKQQYNNTTSIRTIARTKDKKLKLDSKRLYAFQSVNGSILLSDVPKYNNHYRITLAELYKDNKRMTFWPTL